MSIDLRDKRFGRIPKGSTLRASVTSSAKKLNVTGQWDPPGGPTTNLTHAQVFNNTKKAALDKAGTYQARVILVPSSETAQVGATDFVIVDADGNDIRTWSETFSLAKAGDEVTIGEALLTVSVIEEGK